MGKHKQPKQYRRSPVDWLFKGSKHLRNGASPFLVLVSAALGIGIPIFCDQIGRAEYIGPAYLSLALPAPFVLLGFQDSLGQSRTYWKALVGLTLIQVLLVFQLVNLINRTPTVVFFPIVLVDWILTFCFLMFAWARAERE